MDITLKDTLDDIRQATHGIASLQQEHGKQLRLLAEGQAQIIKLLTPEPKDGPSLDELIGHVVGQLDELTGYARQIVKMQSKLEQNLPGDVARVVAAGPGTRAAGNGSDGSYKS